MHTPKPREGSLIVALHRRFEELDKQWAAVDTVQPTCEEGRYHALGAAMSDIAAEVQLVRRALLSQPIVDDWDLSIVTFHLQDLIVEMAESPEGHPGITADQNAAIQASRAVFDYLVSEARIDLDVAGDRLRSTAIQLHSEFLDRNGRPVEAASG